MKKHWQNYTKKVKCHERDWGKFCSRSCSKKNNKNRVGKLRTHEEKRKISESLKKKFQSGELVSPLRSLGLIGLKEELAMNWQGGKTLIGQKIRQSNQYKDWRNEVLKKQNYICQFCKKRGGKLEVDHVSEFSTDYKNRLEVKNGRVLCKDCHKRVTGFRKAEKIELRGAFVDALVELAKIDKRICVVTCDVGFKFLDKFQEKYPDRYFNFGATEQSSMLIASAMALSGLRPIIYSMIPFMVFRPFEILRNGVCYHNAPVIVAGVSGSKAYGFLGMSHNISKNEDINAIWHFPNLHIRLPWTAEETKQYISEAISGNYPLYIRL